MKNHFRLRLIFLLTSFFSSSLVYINAQDRVLSNRVVVGLYPSSGENVYGQLYEFPHEVESYVYDQTHNNLHLTLKQEEANVRYFINFDITSRRTLNYVSLDESKYQVFPSRNSTYINTGTEALKIDNASGKTSSTYKHKLSYIIDSHKLGLSFKDNDGGIVHAINLNTGDKRWKTAINIDGHELWKSVRIIDNDLLLIEANSLFGLSLTNGRAWQHKRINTDPYPAINELNASHALNSEAFSQTGISFISQDQTIGEISSKMLFQKDTLFFAHCDTIMCLGKYGQQIWFQTVEQKTMSHSQLFMDENNVYLINFGFAFQGKNKVPYGKPFVTAYNKQTGEQVFYTPSAKKNDIILGAFIDDKILVLQTISAIVRHDLSSGRYMDEIPAQYASFGFFQIDQTAPLFVKNKKGLVEKVANAQLIKTDKNNFVMYKTTGALLKVDEPALYFTQTCQRGNGAILSNNNKTIIINTKGEIRTELNLPSTAECVDDQIFCIDKNSMYKIPLEK